MRDTVKAIKQKEIVLKVSYQSDAVLRVLISAMFLSGTIYEHIYNGGSFWIIVFLFAVVCVGSSINKFKFRVWNIADNGDVK